MGYSAGSWLCESISAATADRSYQKRSCQCQSLLSQLATVLLATRARRCCSDTLSQLGDPRLWFRYLDRESESSKLVRVQGSDSDHLPRDLFALFVLDRDEHRVFPRGLATGMANLALDAQRRKPRWLVLGGVGIPAKTFAADGTDSGTLKNRRPAVRAGSRFSSSALGPVAHAAVPVSTFGRFARG